MTDSSACTRVAAAPVPGARTGADLDEHVAVA
jgi:hypothetical protein